MNRSRHSLLFISALLVISGVILSPSIAQAKGIPTWVSTSEYKQLSNYVNQTLASKKTTPASVQQKETYRFELTKNREKAEQRSKQLLNRHKARASNIKRNDIKKESRTINRQKSKVFKKINIGFNQKNKRLKKSIDKAITRINQEFNPRLIALSKKMDRLKKEYNNSNPGKRIQLQDKIIDTQDRIDGSLIQKDKKMKKLEKNSRGRFNYLAKQRAKTINYDRREFIKSFNSIKAFYAQRLSVQDAALNSKLIIQVGQAVALYEKGSNYISEMPDLAPTPPTV